MAVVNIITVRKRVLEILAAMPKSARYTDAIGTNADYAVLQEITDAALALDMEVCGDIIDVAESSGGTKFMFPSGNLASGDFIPDHEGARGTVELYNGSAWSNGLLAESEDDMAEVLAHPALYTNVDLWYFIKFRQIVHNANAARIYLPALTKTTVCQAHERWEDAEVYGTIASLEKDGSDPQFFGGYRARYNQERPRARLIGSQVVMAQEIPASREQEVAAS